MIIDDTELCLDKSSSKKKKPKQSQLLRRPDYDPIHYSSESKLHCISTRASGKLKGSSFRKQPERKLKSMTCRQVNAAESKAIPALFIPRCSTKLMLYFHGNAEDVQIAQQ
jgi:hypothetical protein